MEVHHHPDLHHQPKKWKEYALEFLMIFLAVTLGFFAENLREHVTDRSKEKQYMEGFVRNIKTDTASLRQVIEFDKRQVMGIDSLLKLSHVDMMVDTNRKTFYYLAMKYCYNSASFESSDATLQQLKSTGDYRLIEKDHVADSLTQYDDYLHNFVYGQGNYYENYFKDILAKLDDLTDLTVLDDTSYVKDKKLTNKPFPQLRAENGKLTTFFNKLFIFKSITSSYIENNLEPQLQKSNRLLAFLKKEYDLAD